MSGSDSSNDGQRGEEQPSRGDDGGGHTGEGAASAMAHLISEGQRQRRHQPEGEGHPGSQAS